MQSNILTNLGGIQLTQKTFSYQISLVRRLSQGSFGEVGRLLFAKELHPLFRSGKEVGRERQWPWRSSTRDSKCHGSPSWASIRNTSANTATSLECLEVIAKVGNSWLFYFHWLESLNFDVLYHQSMTKCRIYASDSFKLLNSDS